MASLLASWEQGVPEGALGLACHSCRDPRRSRLFLKLSYCSRISANPASELVFRFSGHLG
jgi:hypothetical protein